MSEQLKKLNDDLKPFFETLNDTGRKFAETLVASEGPLHENYKKNPTGDRPALIVMGLIPNNELNEKGETSQSLLVHAIGDPISLVSVVSAAINSEPYLKDVLVHGIKLSSLPPELKRFLNQMTDAFATIK